MTKEPKKIKASDYDSATGPIPLDNFGNDIEPDTNVDKSSGSMYDEMNKWIKANAARK